MLAERHGRRILICDDERHILRLLQVNLERQGHQVYLAADGASALRELQRTEIDVLVIDDGLTCPTTQEVLDTLQSLPNGPEVQVIVMRKRGDPPEGGDSAGQRMPKGPNSGFPPAVVEKPFNPEDLDRLIGS